MLTSLVPVLLTFYIQCVLKFKKNNSGAKGLTSVWDLFTKQFLEESVSSVNVVSLRTVLIEKALTNFCSSFPHFATHFCQIRCRRFPHNAIELL